MKSLSKYLLLCLLVILFIAVGTISAQDGEEQPPVGSKIDPENPNCAVPITSLNGQGFTVSGIAGGLLVEDPNTLPPPTPTPSPTAPTTIQVPTDLFTGVAPNVTDHTAILVVDAFGDVYGTTSDSYLLDDGVLSTITDDIQLEEKYNSGQIPHGVLVFNHIAALLQGAYPTVTPVRTAWGYKWIDPNTSKSVSVIMVNALDYHVATSTAFIAEQIKAMVTLLRDAHYRNFIFNMSFALIPCSYTLQFNADTSGKTLNDYLAEVGVVAEADYQSALIGEVTNSLFNDPVESIVQLCEQTQNQPLPEDSNEVNPEIENNEQLPSAEEQAQRPQVCELGTMTAQFVGAAGNAGFDFSFLPAGYDPVESVSASQDNLVADYSNRGADNGVVGGWFTLSAFTISDANSLKPTTPLIYYRGTSFSAPVTSVCLALNVTSEPVCIGIGRT